jgi:hypothetical protein
MKKPTEKQIRKALQMALFFSDVENYVELPTDVIYDDLLKRTQKLWKKNNLGFPYPESLDMDRDALISSSALFYSKLYEGLLEKHK